LNKAKKVLRVLSSWLDRVVRSLWFFSGALITLMAFVTGYGVFTRYVLRNPNPYTYEIDSILMLACVVFAVAHTQKLGRHLRIDLLDRSLPETLRAILLNVIGPVVGLIFCVVITWKTWETAWSALQNGEVTRGTWVIPTFPIRMMVPLGFGFLCLVLLAQILRHFASLKGTSQSFKE
jgi:TRAP-type mannitol/chloroaromatic compound transport system permease small subunit